jgi:2-dehydro-3-deoxyphosphooctonate aldolase (KDO 8-P synthase)
MRDPFEIKEVIPGQQHSMVLIAGPCVIEDFDTTYAIASFLKKRAAELGLHFVFKASYDKANRTSIHSYRGPGLSEGLKILKEIKSRLDLRILSDVHRIQEVESAAEVLDIIQIPAFLCRQTDILLTIAKTGKPINVKKGQFMAPWDMANVAEKIISSGNHQLWMTERGSMFGYNNLIVDFRGIKILKDMGLPVIFDATHSVQLPGGSGSKSGGQIEFVPTLAKAAIAAGAVGIFMEVHPNPDAALCDGPNSVKLDQLNELLKPVLAIYKNRC